MGHIPSKPGNVNPGPAGSLGTVPGQQGCPGEGVGGARRGLAEEGNEGQGKGRRRE